MNFQTNLIMEFNFAEFDPLPRFFCAGNQLGLFRNHSNDAMVDG